MKASTLFVIVGLAGLAHAHTTVFNILVNDVNQGLGNSDSGYIRSPPNNNPVKDITLKDMTCNMNNVKAAKTISVNGGDKITFQWHHSSDSDSDDIIDKSHTGPIMVYIAPTSSNGAGNVWVKLYEDGYDGSSWAVEKLIKNKGRHSITLPDLASGEYLLRPEIIALHEADIAYNANPARGAQFYMECVQIKVTLDGSKTLPSGVAIPGVYRYSDPGVVFNLYAPFTSYPIPGPKVWDVVSRAPSLSLSSAASNAAASSGITIPCITGALSSITRPSSHLAASEASTLTSRTTTASSPIVLPIESSVATTFFSNESIPTVTTYVTVHTIDCNGFAPSTLLTRISTSSAVMDTKHVSASKREG